MIDPIVVVAASPVLFVVGVVASIAVFAEDRKNPLVRLARVGRSGQDFELVKIRTMTVSAAEGPSITAAGDTRVTRVGRWLRSLRIDEVPQVVQVVTGEMALIGPRPETPGLVNKDDRRWRHVLQARPAIAGMTQVIAGPWEAAELTTDDAEARYEAIALPAKLAIDEWYVDNASPMLDLKIVYSVFRMLVTGADHTPVRAIVEREIPEAAPLLGQPAVEACSTGAQRPK